MGLGRRPVRDIDDMGYATEQRALESMFEGEGWTEDPVIRQAKEWGVKRLIYRHPSSGHKVDVFLDELVMSHTIDMRGRLELAAPTIPLVDLLLSKLQIHEITDNDVLDLPYDVSPDPEEFIRAAMEWHFDPETGSPFWLDRARSLARKAADSPEDDHNALILRALGLDAPKAEPPETGGTALPTATSVDPSPTPRNR